jgi:site-specific recombinase XerD
MVAAIAKEILSNTNSVVVQPTNNFSLKECIDQFWEEKKSEMKPGSYHTYQSSFNKFLKYFDENTLINAIDSSAFVKWRLTQDNTLSPKTVNRDCSLYKNFFDWAINRNIYSSKNPVELANPSKNILRERTKEHQKEYLLFNSNDLKRIFDANRYKQIKKPCAYWLPLLALYSGARLNELASLKIENIEEYEKNKYAFRIIEGLTLLI